MQPLDIIISDFPESCKRELPHAADHGVHHRRDTLRIHIIACRVLTRELSYYAALSPHTVDITWLPQGLHDTPAKLREMVGGAIDALYKQREEGLVKHFPDVRALGYGLCSNGVVGLTARDVPLVVPRTDDCIALFLGSQERYLRVFHEFSGTYWLNNGWIETAFIPSASMLQEKRAQYAERYGEDNADFLMEQDMLWAKNYRTLGYIASPVYQCPAYPALAEETARFNGWQFRTFEGDTRLVRALAEGHWNTEEFLVCPPDHRIEAAYDGRKMIAVPVERRESHGG